MDRKMNRENFDEEIESRLQNESWDERVSKSVFAKREKQSSQKIIGSILLVFFAFVIFYNIEPIQYILSNLFFDESQILSLEPINEITYFLSE